MSTKELEQILQSIIATTPTASKSFVIIKRKKTKRKNVTILDPNSKGATFDRLIRDMRHAHGLNEDLEGSDDYEPLIGDAPRTIGVLDKIGDVVDCGDHPQETKFVDDDGTIYDFFVDASQDEPSIASEGVGAVAAPQDLGEVFATLQALKETLDQDRYKRLKEKCLVSGEENDFFELGDKEDSSLNGAKEIVNFFRENNWEEIKEDATKIIAKIEGILDGNDDDTMQETLLKSLTAEERLLLEKKLLVDDATVQMFNDNFSLKNDVECLSSILLTWFVQDDLRDFDSKQLSLRLFHWYISRGKSPKVTCRKGERKSVLSRLYRVMVWMKGVLKQGARKEEEKVVEDGGVGWSFFEIGKFFFVRPWVELEMRYETL